MVGGKEIAGGSDHFGFLASRDRRLGWAEALVRSGFYLDEYNRPVGVNHDKIDLAALAGKIARQGLEALASEELLGAFLAPLAEQLSVGQQSRSVQQQA